MNTDSMVHNKCHSSSSSKKKNFISLTSLSTLLPFTTRVPLVLTADTNFTWWCYKQHLCDVTSYIEVESRRQMINLAFLLKYCWNVSLFYFYVNSVTTRKGGNANSRSLFLHHFILWAFPKNLPKIWVTIEQIGNSDNQIYIHLSTLLLSTLLPNSHSSIDNLVTERTLS